MIFILFRTLFSALRSRRALALENLALRHQLDVLKRNAKRPRLRATVKAIATREMAWSTPDLMRLDQPLGSGAERWEAVVGLHENRHGGLKSVDRYRYIMRTMGF